MFMTTSYFRFNANGFDLNRNFPDYFAANDEKRQPETLAVMKWADENHFLLHANLHRGILVVIYPYFNYVGGRSTFHSINIVLVILKFMQFVNLLIIKMKI